MTRYVFGAVLASAICAPDVWAKELNHRLRGDGFAEGVVSNRRTSLREVRMTLRDNGYFAATLFAGGDRILVVGTWDGRRDEDRERFTVHTVGGVPFTGRGEVYFRGRGDEPTRLDLQGRSRNRTINAAIQSDDDRDGWGNGGWDDRGRDDNRNNGRARNERITRAIDATTNGRGTIRMPGVRDGDFTALRLRLEPNGEFRIDVRDRTRGTIEGEVEQYNGTSMVLRVRRAMGVNVRGQLTLAMRNSIEVDRAYGSGSGDRGSWQLEFDGDGRSTYPAGRDRDGRYDDDRFAAFASNERGRGTIRQDDGPDLTFNRARVTLRGDRSAVIVLEGRTTIELRGTWRAVGNDDVRVELQSVNEMRARGSVSVDAQGQRLRSFNGSGTTDRGRFSVTFRR